MLNKKSSFKQFVKGNGFYILTGVALIAIVVTAIILPKKGEGNIAEQPEKYAPNRPAAAKEIDDLRVPTIDPRMDQDDNYDITDESAQADVADSSNASSDAESQVSQGNLSEQQEEITSETFSSTTTSKEEIFHTDDDLFAWPLNEQIIYAYSDNNEGKSFVNPTLERTMRSFGIFLKADEQAQVQVAARGKVIDITNYPTADVPPTMDYPQVGTAVVVDHGNDWKTVYGLHQGTAAVKVGDELQLGDIVGTVGKPSKDFTLTGTNLYFQVLKNNVPVNPEDKLDHALDIGVRP